MDKLELVLNEQVDSVSPDSVGSKGRWREQSRQRGLLLYKTDLNSVFEIQVSALIGIIYYLAKKRRN